MNMDVHENRHSIGSKAGMWLFILSEILLFGGLFILYAVYRFKHPSAFHLAAEELSRPLGTINTLILITSSLTMALSILYLRKEDRLSSLMFLLSTLFFGFLFLLIKYFEWAGKISRQIFPDSSRLLERDQGEILFYGLYYSMTGLHALHLLVGLGVLFVMGILIAKQKVNRENIVPLENSGLYWHLVDIIWIFLFPLFYLIT
ncbi:MAG: cytochrome c oxidase subunit 3 family protein [Deltaproteobacteria bacterium]|nr:cytochrome c oxidase subunit 3 family protein [Deltaproteobacteria bacterium]